jgi:hypothetical protein
MFVSLVAIGRAWQPTPSVSPTKHVPIAMPEQAPPGYDPQGYADFRRRCQEVADMSAANLPMGSGDYGYAEACTERGAFFHRVKLLPKPAPLAPTPVVTPGPDGHVPLDIPVSPPLGSLDPGVWANMRKECRRERRVSGGRRPTAKSRSLYYLLPNRHRRLPCRD